MLTTNGLASYNSYDGRKRQLCNGRLHRRIRELTLHPAVEEWASSVDRAYEQVFGAWHRIRGGTDPFDERRILILTRTLERGAAGKTMPRLPLGC